MAQEPDEERSNTAIETQGGQRQEGRMFIPRSAREQAILSVREQSVREQGVLSALEGEIGEQPRSTSRASTFDFSDAAMRAVNDIARFQANVSQTSTPTEEETAAAVAKAIGTYRLLLEEVASGGVVLVRRRNRSTYAVNLK